MNDSHTSSTIVSINNVSKYFGQVVALNNVSLDIKAGEIFALLGPSGCGKSTLLRILSGFETPSEGTILLDGNDLVPLKPNKRPINMVFQSYAVFPHMNVEDNVAYGLKMEGKRKEEIKILVDEALEQVHLAEYAKRKPHQLSGGQRQRVALARVLVKKPRLLLLDEPLSALDAKLRDAMRLELVKLQESVGITFVIVTHDQSEAMAMADRIAVLCDGQLRQIASPAELYEQPVDAFVADFVGTVHMFDVAAIAQSGSETSVVCPELGDVVLPASSGDAMRNSGTAQASPHNDNNSVATGDMVLAIRPEHIRVSSSEPAEEYCGLHGELGDIAFQGQYSIVEIMIAGRASLTATMSNTDAQQLHSQGRGASVWATWPMDQMLLLPKNANSEV